MTWVCYQIDNTCDEQANRLRERKKSSWGIYSRRICTDNSGDAIIHTLSNNALSNHNSKAVFCQCINWVYYFFSRIVDQTLLYINHVLVFYRKHTFSFEWRVFILPGRFWWLILLTFPNSHLSGLCWTCNYFFPAKPFNQIKHLNIKWFIICFSSLCEKAFNLSWIKDRKLKAEVCPSIDFVWSQDIISGAISIELIISEQTVLPHCGYCLFSLYGSGDGSG